MATAADEMTPWLEALSGKLEPWEVEEARDAATAADALSRNLSFGTGGIRGLMGAGPNRMNCLTVGRAAQGLADWLAESVGTRPTVVIGYDTRIHSLDFARATAQVLAANGARVLLFGRPVPTPVADFAIRRLGCDAGVVITASHNPKEYNGFKVYDATGDQATDGMARAIQAHMDLINPFTGVVWSRDGMAVETVSDALMGEYLDAVCSQSADVDCTGLSVVYSPLNGTGLVPAERMLGRLGVGYALVADQTQPDGTFPTCPRPNPELSQAMELGMAQMSAVGADLFMANDPDADRIGVACMDHDGPRLFTGDEVGLLLLDFLGRRASRSASGLPPVAVTTVVSSPLADAIAEAHGVELRRTLTGFKYVGEQVDLLERQGQADRFLFAFEESCGYLRGTYVRDKDGVCALMLVCELAAWYKSQGRTMSQALHGLYARYGYMAGRQLSLELPGTSGRAAIACVMRGLREDPPVSVGGLPVAGTADYSRGAPMPVTGGPSAQVLPPADVLRYDLEGGSRVLVRPSGTEPRLKCYCFGAGGTAVESVSRLEGVCGEMERLLEARAAGGPSRPVHVVLLSGGSGTRLWPLSNSSRSKQFLKVLRDGKGNHVSMVQRVFSQIARVACDLDVTIATSAAQAEELAMQVPRSRYALVAEPERRDTAPAIMLACEHLAREQSASDSDPVVVMPIDTYADQNYYDRIPDVARAVADEVSDLVLLGVRPTYPSEKYGYVLPASTEGSVWPVREFREKPDEAAAKRYIAGGGLWNCGVFAFRLGWLRAVTRRYLDAPGFADYLRRYRELPRNSFDYEVVERASSVSVVPYSGTWKDLGTWNTLTEEMAEPYAGDVHTDPSTIRNVHVINETRLPMVVAGISDAVVVATPDGILVSGKEESAHIKTLVSEAALPNPMQEARPWGSWEALDDPSTGPTPGGVMELRVRAGESTPEATDNAATCYVCVGGSGLAHVDGVSIRLSPGRTATVPAGTRHTIHADVDLSLVKVQIPTVK